MTRRFIVRLFFVMLVSIAALPMAGCGKSGPMAVTVSGDVTYRGKPLQEANVIFMSQKTRPASGRTDSQGRFSFKTFLTGNVETDEQTVCITKSGMNPRANKNDLLSQKISVLPEKYSNPLKSPLKAPVSTNGPNEFHFQLTD
jgi:hypothetical protein